MQINPKRPVRNGVNTAKPTPPAPVRRPMGPRLETFDLIERVVALEHKQVALEVLADAVLSPFLDVFGSTTGALLLYHAHEGTLTLAASRGLSAAGQQHLEILRPGAAGAWEIPLHGLLNRKAYVIEKPHEHPFVPELVARDRGRIANLASIPLYRGSLPVGVLLVIADRRPITEPEIFTHVLAYDVLALALDTGLRARAEHRGAAPVPMVEAPAGGGLVCEEWQDPNEIAQRLQRDLEASEHEREGLLYRVSALESRLTDATTALDAERQGGERTVADRIAAMQEQFARERAAFEQQLTAVRAAADEQLATARATAAHELAGTQDAATDELSAVRDAAARELAEARDTSARQLAAARTTAEKAIADLRATLATREASLAEKLGLLAQREATLAERGNGLVTIGEERDRARQAAVEAGDIVRRLNAEIETWKSELERVRGAHEAVQAESAAHRQRGEMLATELAAARTELSELNGDRSRLLEALGDPDGDPTAAVRSLQTHVGALEEEISALTTARGEQDQRAAADAQAAEHGIATLRRELEEHDAAHRRQLAELQAAQRRETEAAQAAHEREIDSARAAQERGRSAERAAAERTIATVRAESEAAIEASRQVAERLATELEEGRAEIASLREERAAIRGVLEDPTAEPAPAIAAMRARHGALQSEFATLHTRASDVETALTASTRREEEARAAHRAEIERRDDAERSARAALEDQQRRTLEELRSTHRTQLHAAQESAETALTRATASEQERDSLQGELARVRSEATRLREDRERVLAAIDDPNSEPAAVIRELRDQVGTLETQLGTFADQVKKQEVARAELESRGAADLRAAEQRLADTRAELEEARRRERDELEAGWRRARDDAEQAHRRALDDSRDAHERTLAGAATQHQRELAERQTAQRAELETRDAAHAELLARVAATRTEADTLATDLERVRAESARLREERERVLAAVDDPAAEPATLIRALRAEVAALEGRVAKATSERTELERRASSETEALARGTAMLERETAELKTAHTRELEDVRAAHRRELESARAAAERAEAARVAAIADQSAVAERLAVVERERDALAAARQAADAERDQWQGAASVPGEAGSSTHWVLETVDASDASAPETSGTPRAATPSAEPPASAAARIVTPLQPPSEPLPPAVEIGKHRLLERDPTLRDAITAAVEDSLPASPMRLVLANLLALLPDHLDEVDAMARSGGVIGAYAAEGETRSRTLGAVRWFVDPPSAEEAIAALSDARGTRRVITLSDDVDAFIPAKTALTRAGHSVSMACDTKQALDLLTMLSPQAVLVDCRAAPDAVAHFLDALELEKGTIVTMLVLGEGNGRVLKRVVERLLRPRPLVAPDVVTMCRGILAGPPALVKAVPVVPTRGLRPVDRQAAVAPVEPPPASRKPLARRKSR